MFNQVLSGYASTFAPAISGALVGDQATRQANQAANCQRAADVTLQKEFAQNGIRWKVEDAKRAGIHPLAALGAQTMSFSPVSSGSIPETGMAQGLSNMGQDISRAVAATQTSQERQLAALQIQSAKLDVEGKAIDNQLRARQLTPLQGPSFPGSGNLLPGQGNSRVVDKAMERTTSMSGQPAYEPGATTGSGFYVSTRGALVPVPSKDTKEKIEDNTFHEVMHFVRNNILPNITGGNAPDGYRWSVRDQGYVPIFNNRAPRVYSRDQYYLSKDLFDRNSRSYMGRR